MTNYERIKNMNIEEMAQYIQNEDICLVPECNVSYTTPANCYACTKKWLESESEENVKQSNTYGEIHKGP